MRCAILKGIVSTADMYLMKALALLFTLASGPLAFGCYGDGDCNAGSKCRGFQGETQKVCVGGVFPGNSHDQSPPTTKLSPDYGNTCQFNVDCPSSLSCFKPTGGMYGACVRK